MIEEITNTSKPRRSGATGLSSPSRWTCPPRPRGPGRDLAAERAVADDHELDVRVRRAHADRRLEQVRVRLLPAQAPDQADHARLRRQPRRTLHGRRWLWDADAVRDHGELRGIRPLLREDEAGHLVCVAEHAVGARVGEPRREELRPPRVPVEAALAGEADRHAGETPREHAEEVAGVEIPVHDVHALGPQPACRREEPRQRSRTGEARTHAEVADRDAEPLDRRDQRPLGLGDRDLEREASAVEAREQL
jgi:hypothetical protein